jgi:hypothetical protein
LHFYPLHRIQLEENLCFAKTLAELAGPLGLRVMAERDTHRVSRASVPVHKIDFT